MNAKDLIQGDAELWHAATHHAFIDGASRDSHP